MGRGGRGMGRKGNGKAGGEDGGKRDDARQAETLVSGPPHRANGTATNAARPKLYVDRAQIRRTLYPEDASYLKNESEREEEEAQGGGVWRGRRGRDGDVGGRVGLGDGTGGKRAGVCGVDGGSGVGVLWVSRGCAPGGIAIGHMVCSNTKCSRTSQGNGR